MRVVLRIGGSVIASPVNPDLIREYSDLLTALREKRHELVVVVGGGKLARELIAVGKQIGLDEPAQDRIAISVSRIFAQLFTERLDKSGCGVVPTSVGSAAKFLARGKVVVMGGLKPGMTTDSVAALVAKKVKADLVLKATDQDGVYDKDPKKYPDAVKLHHLSFNDLSTVFSEDKHKAGIHQILDPEAIRILLRHRVKVVVVNGFKLDSVIAAVNGKVVGTIIE
jgi:uridylate kinase